MTAPLMNNATFAGLQAMDEANMPASASIIRVAPGTVNGDGSSEPGTTTTTPVSCRYLSPAAGQAAVIFGARITQEADAILSVPLATDVLVTDTITYAGNSFQIIGTNQGQTYATSISLALRLVK